MTFIDSFIRERERERGQEKIWLYFGGRRRKKKGEGKKGKKNNFVSFLVARIRLCKPGLLSATFVPYTYVHPLPNLLPLDRNVQFVSVLGFDETRTVFGSRYRVRSQS